MGNLIKVKTYDNFLNQNRNCKQKLSRDKISKFGKTEGCVRVFGLLHWFKNNSSPAGETGGKGTNIKTTVFFSFEVPLIIGLNWGILVVISASLFQRFQLPIFIKIVLATVLMVFLDFLMEPVANDLDFWYWKNDQIPLYNFVCWFAISLILQYFYGYIYKLAESNRVFNVLYFVMVIFFSLLNIL